MADEEDLRALRQGEVDMARRDFRDAELAGLDLSGRDFEGAHLERANARNANFSGANLTNAQLMNLKAEGAQFVGAVATSTSFFGLNLEGADLTKANFSRSHFSQVNFTGAKLLGADFRNAVINEGTTFENCETDESTLFDGATVFRPTARQSAFRYYTVERGKLVRKPDVKDVHLETLGKQPPHFPAASGEAMFDYSNHNGHAFFGERDWLFETAWSRSGSDNIKLLNDPPSVKGVAIAREAQSIHEVTEAMVDALDFTSRIRSPREGQVAVVENTNGYLIAFEVVRVLSEGHGDGQDRVTLRYSILTDRSRDFSKTSLDKNELASKRRDAIQQIDSLKEAFERMLPEKKPDATHGGMGHNNPPEETPLEYEEHQEAIDALNEIRTEIGKDRPSAAVLDETSGTLKRISSQVASWVARKADMFADEFAKQAGKSLAEAKFLVGGWLVISGQLDKLIATIVSLVS